MSFQPDHQHKIWAIHSLLRNVQRKCNIQKFKKEPAQQNAGLKCLMLNSNKGRSQKTFSIFKPLRLVCLLIFLFTLSGCQSFQKNRDLELYIVGGALTYAAAKAVCRQSHYAEQCGVGAAAAFVIWY